MAFHFLLFERKIGAWEKLIKGNISQLLISELILNQKTFSLIHFLVSQEANKLAKKSLKKIEESKNWKGQKSRLLQGQKMHS